MNYFLIIFQLNYFRIVVELIWHFYFLRMKDKLKVKK